MCQRGQSLNRRHVSIDSRCNSYAEVDTVNMVRYIYFVQDGATPLFKAAHKGHVEVVLELLKYKPNLGVLQVRKKLL